MDEAAFLALTRRIGIEWEAPLAALARRHGVRRWFGFADVVEVPVGQLTPGIGGTFLTNWRPQDEPWPPLGFRFEVIAESDERAQHRCLDTELAALLGPGTPSPAVNVLGSGWQIGVFSVDSLTFLRERRLEGPNPLYDAHPELWRMTRVMIRAAHGSFAPDDSLLPLAAMPPAAVLADAPSPESIPWFGPLVRRNPPTLGRALLADGQYAVRSDGRRLVISAADESLVVDSAGLGDLVLWRLAPARGGGQASLDAVLTPRSAPDRRRAITLMRVYGTDGLDAFAGAVAQCLGLPLAVREGVDE